MGDGFAHFTVSGMGPLRKPLPHYTLTIDRQFYRWGLDYCVVDISDFTEFILPPADHMATTCTNSAYHLDKTRGGTRLHTLLSILTTTKIDVTNFPTEATLTADGPDEVGAIAMGNEAATLKDT
jgi:hypothetical protein